MDSLIKNESESPISNDELLFELIELCALLAAPSFSQAKLIFRANSQMNYPALSDLQIGAPEPLNSEHHYRFNLSELGFEEDVLIDRAQNFICALCDGIESKTGIRSLTGCILIGEIDRDGARTLQWIERGEKGKHDRVLVERRFDRSELIYLVFDTHLSRDLMLAHEAMVSFREHQQAWFKARQQGESDEEDARLLASYHHQSQTIMWGWAHEELEDHIKIAPPISGKLPRVFELPEATLPRLSALLLCERLCIAYDATMLFSRTHGEGENLLETLWMLPKQSALCST